MGSCFSSGQTSDKYRVTTTIVSNNETPKKPREKLDPRDFQFKGLDGVATIVKEPGSIRGLADFVIEDCKNSMMLIKDHCQQISIDNCSNCTIFVGPCEGSFFARDCKDCSFVVVCQQFRMRDCHDCRVQLHVSSQPVIESSNHITFGCLNACYTELPMQFASAKINIWDNLWWHVHDFTGVGNGSRSNFDLVDSQKLVISLGENMSLPLLPFTRGPSTIKGDAIVAIFIPPADSSSLILELREKLSVARSRQMNAHFVTKYLPKLRGLETGVALEIVGSNNADLLKWLEKRGATQIHLSSTAGEYGQMEKIFGIDKE